jgi:hypothetical protein
VKQVNCFLGAGVAMVLACLTDNDPKPLPVQLLAFTATREEGAARLAWATASEVNSQDFQVERSPTAGSLPPLAA